MELNIDIFRNTGKIQYFSVAPVLNIQHTIIVILWEKFDFPAGESYDCAIVIWLKNMLNQYKNALSGLTGSTFRIDENGRIEDNVSLYYGDVENGLVPVASFHKRMEDYTVDKIIC